MTGQPDEFEPETKVDTADGVWEGDAVDVVESEATDDLEVCVDAERREEPLDPGADEEL